MSAQEIIEQIKALPADEQRVVEEFVRNNERTRPVVSGETATQQGVRYADKATFDAAVEKVFENYDELFRRLAQ